MLLYPRPNIRLPGPKPPPTQGKSRNPRRNHNSIIHILRCNRIYSGEQQYHSHISHPSQRNIIYRLLIPSEGERPFAQSFETEVVSVVEAECDNSHVAAIEGWGCDVEDGGDGFNAAEADEVEAAAEKDNEPDAVEGRVGVVVDFP
jgi:hypothetical protein